METTARFAVQAEVLEALAAILKFDASQFHSQEEMSLADAGVDSLGLVEAVFTIEERFDISIPFNANEQSQTESSLMSVGRLVEQIVDLVLHKRTALQLAQA
jgi:acyl carrier protein